MARKPTKPVLSGKRCLVTGAARGVGAAIAQALAAQGAPLPITDIDTETGHDTAARLGAGFRRLDVAAKADWAALMAEVPTTDLLVHTAGISGFETGAQPHDPAHMALADRRRGLCSCGRTWPPASPERPWPSTAG